MKVGLIARCEDRGLGTLTREWYEHMQPDRTLLVIPHSPLEHHVCWYPDAIRADYDGRLDEATVRRFLDGLDVVYSAETYYDWRVPKWAAELGVRTVCHVMPEYWQSQHDAAVDVLWNPTSWRQHLLPPRTRVVPVPVPIERWQPEHLHAASPVRWLHPAGARARSDRNGTMTFLRALEHLKGEHDVTIRSQESWPTPRVGRGVRVEKHEVQVDDYWRLYDNVDAVVLPRKYGGLCMPALEAMGAGCALVMPAVAPNDEWPILGIPAGYDGSELRVYEHRIPLAQTQPQAVAAVMDELAADPGALTSARLRAYGWAMRHSWQSLRPVIVEELERACD